MLPARFTCVDELLGEVVVPVPVVPCMLPEDELPIVPVPCVWVEVDEGGVVLVPVVPVPVVEVPVPEVVGVVWAEAAVIPSNSAAAEAMRVFIAWVVSGEYGKRLKVWPGIRLGEVGD